MESEKRMLPDFLVIHSNLSDYSTKSHGNYRINRHLPLISVSLAQYCQINSENSMINRGSWWNNRNFPRFQTDNSPSNSGNSMNNPSFPRENQTKVLEIVGNLPVQFVDYFSQ